MTDECPEIERTHAMADGELSEAEAAKARDHIADCATCQSELADLMQLGAALASAGPVQAENVVSMAWYRRKKTLVVGGMAMAAAAAATILILSRGATSESVVKPPQIAELNLAPSRSLEVRLGWSSASVHRPYDVQRSGNGARESISLAKLAELEQRGDLRGVAMAYLLNGDVKQARTYLEKSTDATLSDKAALALAAGEAEQALELADRALAANAADTTAQWNRALALRDLGLARAAAAQWQAIAERKEAGWSDEATDRATKLVREADARNDLVKRVIAHGTGGLTVDDANQLPGMTRLYFYDALRVARTPEAVKQLAPIAEALDVASGSKDVSSALARVAATDFAKRAPLAVTYGEILAGKPPTGPARAAYLAKLRAAKADDLLIGALLRLGDNGGREVMAAELAEFVTLTAASPDPWMRLLGVEQSATAAIKRGDRAIAEADLLRVRSGCAVPYRCARLDMLLGDIYVDFLRMAEARTVLDDAWRTAHRAGETFTENLLLVKLADMAAFRDDAIGSGLPLVRAYTDELHLRDPANCYYETHRRTTVALVYINQLRLDAARAELARASCPLAPSDRLMWIQSQILRELGTPAEITALRSEIAAGRAEPSLSPTVRAMLDQIEGRLLIEREPEVALPLLRRAIEAVKELPPDVEARRVRAFSFAVLVLAAAKAHDGGRTLELLAEEAGVPLPATCVAGLAADDQRQLVVVRDKAGVTTVHYDETRRTTTIDPATLVPPALVSAMAGCEHVDVLARAPLHGTPRLLPADVAWRYLSPRKAPPGAPATRSILIADAEPPASLGLPRLAAWKEDPGATLIAGASATPSRVLAAMADAGEIVIDVHGLVGLGPDASFLALSPEPDGRYALTARMVRETPLRGSPLVVLAACHGSHVGAVLHEPWSLPAAFVHSGARAVVASPEPMPDRDAAVFFAELRTRIRNGAPVAIALRDVRAAWLSANRGNWVRDLIVFE